MHQELVFCLSTNRDLPLLYPCLLRLRFLYPTSRIILCADGDEDPRIRRIAGLFWCKFISTPRYYELEHGGKYWERFLLAFLNGPGDVLVKIDTDTKFFRRFTVPFEKADAFGTITRIVRGNTRHTQGGCKAITRDFAWKIVYSKILGSYAMMNPFAWAHPKRAEDFAQAQLISEDRQMWWIQEELGAKRRNHPEIFSVWLDKRAWCMSVSEKRKVGNGNLKYAVTHPHDFISMWNGILYAPLTRDLVTMLARQEYQKRKGADGAEAPPAPQGEGGS
jgi:hypothetical protein